MLFDRDIALILEFSPDGILRGASSLTEPQALRELDALMDALLAKSTPFATFRRDLRAAVDGRGQRAAARG
jgi:hypothetical protein